MVIKLKNDHKVLVIINLYWMPTTSPKGLYCSLTQYNIIDRKAKLTTEYRKEIFKQLQYYMKNNQDIMISL